MPPLITFDQSKDEIARLVKHYQTNRVYYRSPGYKETQARGEFLDKFFEHLGWDVCNLEQAAPRFREVVLEDSLEIEGQRKAPDYAFRIGETLLFYVEAKKPGVDVKNDPLPAYQLRRYGWSGKLALSLLTDFEELAVYDCRSRPSLKDKASTARINYYACEEYADRWRELWDVFSREAVRGGSFDQFAETAKGRRGTSAVDAEFLKEIEGWRDVLARNLALRNPKLGIDDLNDAVQKIIDRLIFLRMAEDRGVEDYGRLQRHAQGDGVYRGLIRMFRHAEVRYDSGLFDFSRGGDRLTPKLNADDKVLRPIIASLYFPQSPYEFSVLPVEILGNIYEQFLGQTIKLTEGHRARVEVKKAGGVYYTPTYIVDYIVKHTVGVALAGRSPQELRGFRVLDAACGSGSFLLGAYQFLLDYYQGWYAAHEPEKHKQAVQQTAEGWALTLEERKRILTEHLFGVDIDRQAVEVTKLSLLLKVLEGVKQLGMFEERILPNLDANIKCGNSLIGPDYFADRLFPDDAELKRVNPFDWQKEFPQVFGSRPGSPQTTQVSPTQGFEVVIGNPPYVRIQTMTEWAPLEVEAYKQQYRAARSGNYDLYVVFVEKGLSLLNAHGRLGFILPHKFFNAQYGQPLRELLAQGQHVSEVIHFGDQQVFAGATTYTCLLFLNKSKTDQLRVVKVSDLGAWRTTGQATEGQIPTANITAADWNFMIGKGAALFEKLSQMPVKLENAADRIFQGIKTSADKIYIVEELERKSKQVRVYSPEREAEYWLESDLLHPLIKGGDSKRYNLARTNRLILFPYARFDGDESTLIPEKVLKLRYPMTWEYLIENKDYLEGRENGRMRGPKWYGYVYPKALDVMPLPKIFTPDIATRAAFSLDETGDLFFTGGVAGGYGVLVSQDFSREYVLGLLNSKLLDWMVRQTATQMRGGWYSFESRFIRNLPIRPINFSDSADKARHDHMVALLEKILDLHKRKAAAGSAGEAERLQRLIDDTDAQIDALVYTLYGLTEDEIWVVEGK